MPNDYSEYIVQKKGYGVTTANSGTVYTRLIEPLGDGARSRVVGMRMRVGATAKTLYLLRPLNKVITTAVAAAGQAVINISADPGNYSAISASIRTGNNLIAANDFVAYQVADGTWCSDTVSSVSTLAITMTNNVPTGGIPAGNSFWWFGIQTDTNPNDGLVHPSWNALANSTTIWDRSDCVGTIPDNPFMSLGHGIGQPLLFYCANASDQSWLESVGVEYVRKAA